MITFVGVRASPLKFVRYGAQPERDLGRSAPSADRASVYIQSDGWITCPAALAKLNSASAITKNPIR
jgi:hypothetical protein